MTLNLYQNRTLREVQQDFNDQYPYLKLEFYKVLDSDPNLITRKRFDNSTILRAAGLRQGGAVEIEDNMTVSELEDALQNFGLAAQVSRKAGISWLETTMTDNWSLQKQNEHGREISAHTPLKPPLDADIL
jgi:hypothetical protein